MLNALELAGFKSFPDRTRFDFPPGITVVVGPNGSGKSNIVDAIKWVLGEQSAKSLRGKDMSDVIFKGSGGPSGRRPSNSAETTIFLSNEERRLRIDQDEVSVTRRVYRSGESEYMINGEPCRLKDIRNLFRGTGIGVDAYSLIEQGKVDKVLQASARDRRAMFEEAAGISRFKAKKVETERRLARVEQNLVRLADIVEEVEGSYKRIKNQASKAAKFKEHTERLRSLRTYVGQKDWRDFSKTLDEILKSKNELESFLEERNSQLQAQETESTELDKKLSEYSTEAAAVQRELGELLQVIADRQSQLSLTKTRIDDQDVQTRQLRETLTQVEQKIEVGQRERESGEQELSKANQQLIESRQQLEQADAKLTETTQAIENLKAQIESGRETHMQALKVISSLAQDVSGSESQLQSHEQTRTRLTSASQKLRESLAEKKKQLALTDEEQGQLRLEAEEKDSKLRVARERLDRLKGDLEDHKRSLDQLHRDQVGATQRGEVIQELENQQAGVDAGVKELMLRSQDQDPGIYADIVGLVADLIKVNIEHAELIDLALGEKAQHIVVQGNRLIEAVAEGKIRLNGRVGLILLNPDREQEMSERNLHDQMGVVGRLDQLVHAKTEHHAVIQHLLGNTWLVKSLGIALELRRRTSHPFTRFVTLEGEIVEADGSVVCGSRASVAGIVSRRSELRVLHRKLQEIAGQIELGQTKVDSQTRLVEEQESKIEALFTEHTELSSRLNESRTRATLLGNEIAALEAEDQSVTAELTEAVESLQAVGAKLKSTQEQLVDKRAQADEVQRRTSQNEGSLGQLEEQRQGLEHGVTSNKVTLAKCEQQVADLSSRMQLMQNQQDEHVALLGESRGRTAGLLWQRRSAVRSVVEFDNELTELNSKKGQLDSQLEELNVRREEAEAKRRDRAKRLGELRDTLRSKQEQLHEFLMREKDLSMQRSQLAERLKEDYDIDIDQLEESKTEIDEDRDEIDEEINQLRKKLNNIGPVNMDALAELEDVEQRYEALSGQYNDLVEAKETLEKIIVRINNDSRKLFVETLEQIRTNFQTLFRQTFGGGKADLIIEEGVDVLEAGIDITATPPGKPQFDNSLLSGGEKALTAVSLLMAIFKFRPSPFCILDEVDAPFDEANVGRFIETLRSFLGWTKFIIVTHSKKTMTAANTLYGVTMQESGVSKRVSVQFEDVNERGEISERAVQRSDDEADEDKLGVA